MILLKQSADHLELLTTSSSETSYSTIATPKKRRRGRRRRSKNDTPNNTSCSITSGNVSESSSEQSKHSLHRAMALKKSKETISPQTLSLHERAQYLALDCEMVGVGPYGSRSALARVTIVNWDGDIIYDQLIRPTETVTDYRTFVSGICAEDFDDYEQVMNIETCRAQVLDLLKGKILVGHALKNDLYALQLNHPWQQIRDTAKYEPFMKQRFEDGIYWPRKLKDLVYEHLDGMEIQKLGHPHSAYEDAHSAMLLYQNVRTKWEKVMTYKIKKTAEIEQLKQQQNSEINCLCCLDGSRKLSNLVSSNVCQQNSTWPALVSPIA
jgi:RNA exonuclease 4